MEYFNSNYGSTTGVMLPKGGRDFTIAIHKMWHVQRQVVLNNSLYRSRFISRIALATGFGGGISPAQSMAIT